MIGSEKAEFFADPEVVQALAAKGRCSRTTGSPPSAPAATPAEPPERHLERQLGALYEEAAAIADALREAEARRQETHTRYLEDRHR